MPVMVAHKGQYSSNVHDEAIDNGSVNFEQVSALILIIKASSMKYIKSFAEGRGGCIHVKKVWPPSSCG